MSNVLEEAFVYRNNLRETVGTHFLRVRLAGPPANTSGIGARVRLVVGDTRQTQEMQLTRGYQSSVEPLLHFGLGESAAVDTVEVRWPDGSVQKRNDVNVDATLTLDYLEAQPGIPAPGPAPFFVDADALLRPTPFHTGSLSALDTALEPYPTRRERLALAVGDLDGDGLDDFVFGGSQSRPSVVYFQRQDGSFAAAARLPVGATMSETTAAAIFDADGDGLDDLWTVGGHAAALNRPEHRHTLFLNAGGGQFRPATEAATRQAGQGTTLAPGDYDGDGRVDLFVGGHTLPGSGPTTGSRLLRNSGDGFVDVTAEVAPALAQLETVTDALWADLDGDGKSDLLVAGEWIPPTLLLNEAGRLRNATSAAGLQGLSGWWQNLAAADFDRDGDLDVVAGNIGLNYPYSPSREEPFELYIADFNGDGEDERVPGYHEGGIPYPWFGRDHLGSMLPWVPQLFPTLDAFARATLPDILGADRMQTAQRLDISTLASMYFENDGSGGLTPHPLPRAAQISAVTGILAADFDGDGALDLVVAGNYPALDQSVAGLDGSVGLFLRGDGAGGFDPVHPGTSGLWLPGVVRDLALLRVGSGGDPAILAGIASGEAVHVRPVKPAVS